MKKVLIITDGSCSGNPGPGGWSAILQYKNTEMAIGGNAANTTNNQMELTAVINALQALKEACEVIVITDSAYIANTANGGWIHKWGSRGWQTASNKPVKNRELWEVVAQLIKRHDVKFQHVRGHAGNYLNERADSAARKMCEQAKNGKIVHKVILEKPNVITV